MGIEIVFKVSYWLLKGSIFTIDFQNPLYQSVLPRGVGVRTLVLQCNVRLNTRHKQPDIEQW